MSETISLQMAMAETIHRLAKRSNISLTRVAGTCPVHGEFNSFAINESIGSEPKCYKCVLENQKEIDKRENVDLSADNGLFTFWNAGKTQNIIPPRFLDSTFSSYIPVIREQFDIRDKLINYATDFKSNINKNQNIIMSGNVGTGKTHLAIALGRRLADSGFRIAYLSIFDLMHPSQKDAVESVRRTIDRLSSYDLVILDEIGAHPDFGFSTELVTTTLFQLIDSRYMNCLATVIITNIGAGELATSKAGLGDRAMDRIKDSIILKFLWKSAR